MIAQEDVMRPALNFALMAKFRAFAIARGSQ